jgi:uncharacterized membrane protein YjjB (DUF3815 family)
MTVTEIAQILSGFVGTLCFGILFRIRGWRLCAVSLGGLLSWFLFVILNRWIPNEVVNYFIVALVISLYNEIMARVLKTPTTMFVTTSLIPLIPGGSLYYTMAYAFEGNREHFLEKAIYTLQLASALALGIILAATLTKIVCNLLAARKSPDAHA